jgi:hypothetical protein
VKRWLRRTFALVLTAAPLLAAANQSSVSGPGSQSTSTTMDFNVAIGGYLFLRVGTGAYPTADSTINTVTLNVGATIPGGAVTAVDGNSTSVNWNGAAATLTSPTPVPVAVEVHSNAGQVTLRANVVAPLTSGGNSIPLSQITVSSSSGNLPAPVIPDAGTGASVNITPSSQQNLVTDRSATWTFSYTPNPAQAPGSYTGQISFTASTP